MDVTRAFFGKLRDLALTVEKDVKQLERAMLREDVGKRSPRPWAARVGLVASHLLLGAPCPVCAPLGVPLVGPGVSLGVARLGIVFGSSSSRCLSELLCGCVAEFLSRRKTG